MRRTDRQRQVSGFDLKVAAVGGVVTMTTRRSRRTRCTFFSSPSSRSVLTLRSCASDTTTTLENSVVAVPS